MRVALALLLVGCASQTKLVTPTPPPDHALESALADTCGSCHDGSEPRRPIFEATHVLDRYDASRVALAIASGSMPPAPTKLVDDTRRKLIELACAREAEPASCVAQMGRAAPERWLVGTDAITRIVERTATKSGVPSDPQSRSALEPTLRLTEPDARAVRLDASLATMIALYAAERCGDPSSASYTACVSAVTDYRAWSLPQRGAP